MPFHLVRSRRFKDLFENGNLWLIVINQSPIHLLYFVTCDKKVLFNYEWLHAKLSSCPLQAVLLV